MKTLKILLGLLAVCSISALSFAGQKLKTGAPGATPPKHGQKVAVIDTNFGRIVIKFFPNVAPNTVKNFEKLANKGFFDGCTFHRVIPGFMIQGGDPNTKPGGNGLAGQGGPGYTIKDEFGNIHHARGIVSMAHTSEPNSAGSQFFIMTNDDSPDHLDHKYAAFGQVIQGMNVVDKIVMLPRDGNDMPTPTSAVMKKVKITTWPLKG